jgi:hypothetical protein
MKKVFLLFFLMGSFAVHGQQHQLGLRVGEPISITYKTYLNKVYSAEALIGRGSPNNSRYYRRSFENNRPLSSAIYNGHSVSDAFSLNLRLAYNENLNAEFDIAEGELLGYGGLGIQLRNVQADYTYQIPSGTDNLPVRTTSRSNIDFGPEAFAGAEYIFRDYPVAVFAELGLFLELLDRFGHLKIQGGIGARYLF